MTPKLPPLPLDEALRLEEDHFFTEKQMLAYAIAAIEAQGVPDAQAAVVHQEPLKVDKASVLELGRKIGLIGWVSEDGMYFQFTETENASSLLVDLVQRFTPHHSQQAKPQPLSDEQWQAIADLMDSFITREVKDGIEKVLGVKERT